MWTDWSDTGLLSAAGSTLASTWLVATALTADWLVATALTADWLVAAVVTADWLAAALLADSTVKLCSDWLDGTVAVAISAGA